MNKLLLCVFGDINNLNNDNRELVRYHFQTTKEIRRLVDGQTGCPKRQGLEQGEIEIKYGTNIQEKDRTSTSDYKPHPLWSKCFERNPHSVKYNGSLDQTAESEVLLDNDIWKTLVAGNQE
jgi:hypothetical protein